MLARPARHRLLCGSCSSTRGVCSTLPPHARSPSRSCASLRSLWSAHGRTCTSKIAPVLGAQRKGPLIERSAGLCCNPAEVKMFHPPSLGLPRQAPFPWACSGRRLFIVVSQSTSPDKTHRLSSWKVVGAAGGQKEKSLLIRRSTGSFCNPAASYFPTASQQQYHRPWRA